MKVEKFAVMVAALAAGVLVACSSDATDDSSVVSTPVIVDPRPTTTTVPPTTTPTTTASPMTTAPPMTIPPMTLPPVTAPPVTAPPATAPSSTSASLDGFDLAACRSLGAPGIEQGNAAARATACSYLAWQAGDRQLAATFADPPAVEALFEFSGGSDWIYRGCAADSGYGWLGTSCSFTEPGQPGDLHGVAIIFVPIAYDDVLVIGSIEVLG